MPELWQYDKPEVGEVIQTEDGEIGMVMEIEETPAHLRMFGAYRIVVQREPDQSDEEWETWYLSRGEYTIEG